MSVEKLEQVLGPPLRLPARLKRWELHFRVAGCEWELDPLLLAAVCDRESLGGDALTPRAFFGTGDYEHGRGLMQVDDRAHTIWVQRSEWRDPLTNIRKGAEILAGELQRFKQGGAQAPTRCALAAYNCGSGAVRKALEAGKDVDFYTTKADYSADVLRRYEAFRTMQA